MKMKLFFIMICIFAIVTGCSNKEKDEVQFQGNFKSGDIYELTDNPFQEGLEYEFTAKELEEIEYILGQAAYKKAIRIPGENGIKYIADFYNEKGDELLSIAIDKKYRLYTGNGERIKSEKLEEYLKRYTE